MAVRSDTAAVSQNWAARFHLLRFDLCLWPVAKDLDAIVDRGIEFRDVAGVAEREAVVARGCRTDGLRGQGAGAEIGAAGNAKPEEFDHGKNDTHAAGSSSAAAGASAKRGA